ncbi:glutathione S-transferase 1-like [Rhipicephalus microplus]|uniref:glutathione S-transferase 1-like n=1 Tax=Rhipicephalus microplus TaxID=6941 RepID=UPI003F6B6CEE
MTITLYNWPGSPPCGFVLAVAKQLGVQLEVKNVNLAQKEQLSEPYLKINPFHKVPALDDDGFIFYESAAIVYYLLRKYAPKSDLYPDDIKLRTQVDQVIAVMYGTVHASVAAFFRPRILLKKKPSAEELTAYEDNVVKSIEKITGEGKFAVGDKLTLADIAIIPQLMLIVEGPVVDLKKYPKLVSYYSNIKSQLLYFEELYGPTINHIKQRWATLQ